MLKEHTDEVRKNGSYLHHDPGNTLSLFLHLFSGANIRGYPGAGAQLFLSPSSTAHNGESAVDGGAALARSRGAWELGADKLEQGYSCGAARGL